MATGFQNEKFAKKRFTRIGHSKIPYKVVECLKHLSEEKCHKVKKRRNVRIPYEERFSTRSMTGHLLFNQDIVERKVKCGRTIKYEFRLGLRGFAHGALGATFV